jgi:tyrosinase
LQEAPSVASQIAEAMPASLYGGFQTGGYSQPIMGAHDDGHVCCGNTMAQQDVASYDPIFWFFHCNWERLFWSWQVNASATDVAGFTATLDGDTDFLPLALNPYPDSTQQVIPYSEVTYDALDTGAAPMLANKAGHVLASNSFTIEPSTPVSIRVKDIDRMSIPGTFIVRLLADGEPIARRAFFQPRSPRTCKTCQARQLVSLDFHLPQEQIQGRKLSIAIEVPSLGEGEAARFPLEQAGNPTINARLLLNEA